MITLKQVEKDERWAVTVIKNFITNHPIFTSFASIIILMFIIAVVGVIMMMAAVGGGVVEKTWKDKIESGQITLQEYQGYSIVMDIMLFCYNFINAFIGFVVGAFILFWSYIGFKEFLRYNRDVL
jgi:hypothetical protein